MSDPTDKQITEAAWLRWAAENEGNPDADGSGRTADRAAFMGGFAAHQVPEDVATLCSICGAPGEHLKSPGGSWWVHNAGHHPEDEHDFEPVLSSRTVAPNREALVNVVSNAMIRAKTDTPEGVADALLAADLWQPVPVIDRDAEALARAFHENYERLAPEFGYKTRERSAVPWEDVPADNKALMVATVDALLASGWQPASPTRFDPEFRADLIDFARQRIEMVWADVPGGVDAATLASNIVAAQEFCWMSRQVPVTQPASPRTVTTVESGKVLPTEPGSVVNVDGDWAMLTKFGNWVTEGVFTLTPEELQAEDFRVLYVPSEGVES